MTHEVAHIGLYVIFGIVLLPVYLMLIGWFVGKPQYFRAIALTLGFMISYAISIIIGIFVMGVVLSVFVG